MACRPRHNAPTSSVLTSTTMVAAPDKLTVVVLKRVDPADSTSRHESCIDADATLDKVREILTVDRIMGEHDRFYVNRARLGVSAESGRRFADLGLKASFAFRLELPSGLTVLVSGEGVRKGRRAA